jgi:uncharacterized membrane protein YagU involved in acid resistance
MSVGTETESEIVVENGSWVSGMLAGLAGSVVMAAAMLAMGATPVLAGAIPGLYTLAPPANPAAGLFVHLSHGAVLGVVFLAVLNAAGVSDPRRIVAAGVGYGVLAWVLLAALVMPVWLGAVGFPNAPGFPNFAPPSLLWHLVYGATLGAVVVALER